MHSVMRYLMNPDPYFPFDPADPKIRESLETLLVLAAQKGDEETVRERLRWGVDPNCRTRKGRTPLIANVKGICPNANVVKALLAAGADVALTDEAGLSALDYARRKLIKTQAKPRRPAARSASLDENNQVQMNAMDEEFLERMRRDLPAEDAREAVRMYYQERRKAARRVFNDPAQVEAIVELLE